jgi:CheY-like chemotaxis protein
MKILVVDDEQGLGSMMCRTLRALGHEAILALHPEDALAMVDASYDAVVSDIDMPGMSGVELVDAIRARQDDVPVAFCTGSDPGESTLASAAARGRVITKPWTMDDIHSMVADLEKPHPDARPTMPMSAPPTMERPVVRRVIRLTVHSWEQVRRLCARQSQGPVLLPLRVPGLNEGQEVTLRLALPDGFAVSIAATVRLHDGGGGRDSSLEQALELIGLDSSLVARLSALADATGRENEVDTADEHAPAESWENALARGSQPMKVSELLLSNRRLKAQIEGLAGKMRPRGRGGRGSS